MLSKYLVVPISLNLVLFLYSGPYPHWLFLSSRGELRLLPMSIDGSVSTFSPFHNVNCPHGFLYFNRNAELRICVLPAHLSYDAPWPVRKVPLRHDFSLDIFFPCIHCFIKQFLGFLGFEVCSFVSSLAFL
jgi:hypothetical protein